MKISSIHESKFNYFVSKASTENVVSIVKTSFNNPPSIFGYTSDGKKFIDSNAIIVLKINSSKFKPLRYARYNEIGKEASNLNLIDVYNNLIRFLDRPKLLADESNFKMFTSAMEKYSSALEKDGVFKIYKFSNSTDLLKSLVTELKIQPEAIKRAFDLDVKEQQDLPWKKIGKTEIVVPDNMRKNRISDIEKLVYVSNGILKDAGLEKLTDVKMLIVPIGGKAIGHYYPESKLIKIDPSAKATKYGVKTILHEYGHKLFYEFLNSQQQKDISEKFIDVYSNKSPTQQNIKNILQVSSSIKDLMKDVHPGNQIEYIGRKKKFKENSPYTVEEIGENNLKLKSINNPWYTLSGALHSFINNGFSTNGKNLSIDIPESEEKINPGWFPTEYSKTNYHEWFSEIFAYVLLGLVKEKEVVNFVKSFLK